MRFDSLQDCACRLGIAQFGRAPRSGRGDRGFKYHYPDYDDLVDRKEYLRNYQREWLAQRRRRGIELLGGKCAWCERTDNLEIDHIIPARKLGYTSPGGGLWSWSWSRIVAELQKCWLLCEECHRVKTRDDMPDSLHGTAAMYHNKRCRCDICRAWMRDYKRDYRTRKGQ